MARLWKVAPFKVKPAKPSDKGITFQGRRYALRINGRHVGLFDSRKEAREFRDTFFPA